MTHNITKDNQNDKVLTEKTIFFQEILYDIGSKSCQCIQEKEIPDHIHFLISLPIGIFKQVNVYESDTWQESSSFLKIPHIVL